MVEEFRQQRQLEENMMEMLEDERKRAEEERRREVTAKELGRFHVRVGLQAYDLHVNGYSASHICSKQILRGQVI